MDDTLINPTAVQIISGIGIVLCSVALLVGVVLIFWVKGSVPHAVLSDAASYPMVEVFLTTAMLRTTAITFDIVVLAGLPDILPTMGLVRVTPRGRR